MPKQSMHDEGMHPVQKEIYRSMTPEQKYKIGMSIYWTVRKWKAAGIRMQHPDWSEEQVQAKVKEIFLYVRT